METSQGENADRGKDEGSDEPDGFDRELVSNPIADQYGGDVRQHHAECRAEDDRVELIEPGGETDRGNLCLVADFGEKEGGERR